jgi:hypothetical protein
VVKINERQKIYTKNKKKKLVLWKNIQFDKSLTNLNKMRREKTQISKIRNKTGEIATNTTEIQGIIWDCFTNLYSNTLENLEEMDKLLDSNDH